MLMIIFVILIVVRVLYFTFNMITNPLLGICIDSSEFSTKSLNILSDCVVKSVIHINRIILALREIRFNRIGEIREEANEALGWTRETPVRVPRFSVIGTKTL